MRESELESYLIRRVTEAGGITRKVEWIGRRGAPDRVCFFPGGKTAWVELKTLTGKLSRTQIHEIETLRKLGADVRVIRQGTDIAKLIREAT